MSKKGIGIGAFDRSRLTSAHYASHGSSLRANDAHALEAQLAVFRTLLHHFAATHAKDIRSDPSFRAQFARMCAAIGVDPLASSSSSSPSSSSSSSIWAQLLGKTVNDFYFDVAVRVVQICGASRAENGGLISLEQLRARVASDKLAGSAGADTGTGTGTGTRTHTRTGTEISQDDIRRAVATLEPLGGRYAIVTVGQRDYVRSVSRELARDQACCLEAAQALGYVTVRILRDNLTWEPARARTVIDDLLAHGLLWVDTQTGGGDWQYWSPAFMAGLAVDKEL